MIVNYYCAIVLWVLGHRPYPIHVELENGVTANVLHTTIVCGNMIFMSKPQQTTKMDKALALVAKTANDAADAIWALPKGDGGESTKAD